MMIKESISIIESFAFSFALRAAVIAGKVPPPEVLVKLFLVLYL